MSRQGRPSFLRQALNNVFSRSEIDEFDRQIREVARGRIDPQRAVRNRISRGVALAAFAVAASLVGTAFAEPLSTLISRSMLVALAAVILSTFARWPVVLAAVLVLSAVLFLVLPTPSKGEPAATSIGAPSAPSPSANAGRTPCPAKPDAATVLLADGEAQARVPQVRVLVRKGSAVARSGRP